MIDWFVGWLCTDRLGGGVEGGAGGGALSVSTLVPVLFLSLSSSSRGDKACGMPTRGPGVVAVSSGPCDSIGSSVAAVRIVHPTPLSSAGCWRGFFSFFHEIIIAITTAGSMFLLWLERQEGGERVFFSSSLTFLCH